MPEENRNNTPDPKYWKQKKSEDEKIGAKGWLPFIAAMLVVFYVLPPILRGTRFFGFALKVFTPACCLGSGVIFGKMHGWVWYYFAVTALIFAPSMVLNYSQGDIHYIFEYAALAFVGSLIGYAFHRDKY